MRIINVKHLIIITSWFKLSCLVSLVVSYSTSPEDVTTRLRNRIPRRIQVCHHKNCIKQFPSTAGADGLFQVFSDLIPPSEESYIRVESVGCLSQCGKGPNVHVTIEPPPTDPVQVKRGGLSTNDSLHFGVTDAYIAADILKQQCDFDVPPILLAAVDLMAQASKAQSFERKRKLLDSVVQTLSENEPLSRSMAILHAYVMRADIKLEGIPRDIQGALADSRMATNIVSTTRLSCSNSDSLPKDTLVLVGKAYRIRADAEEMAGNLFEALDALSKWADVHPSFGIKVQKEKDRISRMLQSTRGDDSKSP